MLNDTSLLSRRRFAAGLALGTVAFALPMRAAALTVDQARALIDKAVGDINAVIASGKGEAAMIGDLVRNCASVDTTERWIRGAWWATCRQASASGSRSSAACCRTPSC